MRDNNTRWNLRNLVAVIVLILLGLKCGFTAWTSDSNFLVKIWLISGMVFFWGSAMYFYSLRQKQTKMSDPSASVAL